MMIRALIVLVLLAVPRLTLASPVPDLSSLAFEQRPGSQIPLGASFRDENGRTVRLSDLIRGKPLILSFLYFRCPNICGVVRGDLFNALSASGMTPGRDYTLVALSIDPSETSDDARAAKTEELQRHSVNAAEQNWHFLIGSAEPVQAVADAVGFHYRFDPELKQFIHSVGVVFVSPSGIVSNYLLGVGYEPSDVRLGVTRAEKGTIAAAAMPVLLLCFNYDATTGRYSLAIVKLLRLFAALTVITIAVTLYLAFRRERGSP